jgi:hypothetical protein
MEVFGMSVSWEIENRTLGWYIHVYMHVYLPFGSVRNGDYYYKEQNETKRFASRHYKTLRFRFVY